ncbi:MAG: sensor histidine kinase [Hyphomicrobium sp.]
MAGRQHGACRSPAWYDLVEQIGHDLRTPLNAVIGFSDVMSAELLGPVGHPRYREYAGDIRDSGRRLLKAAEDTIAVTTLLAQAKDDAPVRLSVPALAMAAWSALANDAAARHAELVIEIEDDTEAEVLAPELALRQALVNLISEALSRSMPGGRIVLKAIPEDNAIRLEITAETAGVRRGPATLPFSLARALLELQGAGLLEFHEPGRWTAVTILDRATQRDFFSDAFRTSAPGMAAGVVRRKAPVYA